MVFEQFQGVFAPIPTPFSLKDKAINFDFIQRHLQFLSDRGINGIVVLGTNGEFPSLSIEERKSIIAWVMKFRAGLKVIVQTGSSSFVETVGLCDYAREMGADGLLISCPYYFKSIADEALIEYYREILNRIQHPIFLYNMPQTTRVTITKHTVEALLSFRHLVGLKDSSGNWEDTKSYIESFRSLHIFVGNDTLINSGLQAGAGGSITAATNTVPELLVEIYSSRNNPQKQNELQQKLSDYRKLFQKFPIHAATKYLLHLRGFDESSVRAPLQNLTESHKRELERDLEKLGIVFQG
ncbi:MAG TPA: dihydrodipicolinate synthase family protein, partial [bacterium]